MEFSVTGVETEYSSIPFSSSKNIPNNVKHQGTQQKFILNQLTQRCIFHLQKNKPQNRTRSKGPKIHILESRSSPSWNLEAYQAKPRIYLSNNA